MTRRLLQHIGVGTLLAPVIVICIWCAWVVNAFQLQEAYGHNLVWAGAMAFTKNVQNAPPLAVGRNERSWGGLDAHPKMQLNLF